MDEPKTLQEALVYFGDPERAFQYAVQLALAGGNVTCPTVAATPSTRSSRLSPHLVLLRLPKQFTVKVGTIMEDSRLDSTSG
jgi:hypothetical protein